MGFRPRPQLGFWATEFGSSGSLQVNGSVQARRVPAAAIETTGCDHRKQGSDAPSSLPGDPSMLAQGSVLKTFRDPCSPPSVTPLGRT